MNYTESLAYLDSLGKFGIKLGMERIEGLLRELGNPEQKIKTVHVTGTNGKGSVTSMITNILLAANLKVGKFTSPHLVKYNERQGYQRRGFCYGDYCGKGCCRQRCQKGRVRAADAV